MRENALTEHRGRPARQNADCATADEETHDQAARGGDVGLEAEVHGGSVRGEVGQGARRPGLYTELQGRYRQRRSQLPWLRSALV